MLHEREYNDVIHCSQQKNLADAVDMQADELPRHIDCTDQTSIDRYLEHYDCKKKGGIARYVLGKAGKDIVLKSNGENAAELFAEQIEDGGLYLLDEPENSLSPEKQLAMKEFVEIMASQCRCQFIIATHSPFLLALDNALIYNLDARPVATPKWTELENVRVYHKFFIKYQQLLK